MRYKNRLLQLQRTLYSSRLEQEEEKQIAWASVSAESFWGNKEREPLLSWGCFCRWCSCCYYYYYYYRQNWYQRCMWQLHLHHFGLIFTQCGQLVLESPVAKYQWVRALHSFLLAYNKLQHAPHNQFIFFWGQVTRYSEYASLSTIVT